MKRLSSLRLRASDSVTCRAGRSSESPRTLTDIVAHYRAKYAEGAAAEREYYAQFATLREAVLHAGLARSRDESRHPHQYRLSAGVLAGCAAKLEAALPRIAQVQDFDALFAIVQRTIGPIRGIGELMVYDTSTRIGAKLGLEPTRVFLHRGVRVGARRLGLATNRQALSMGEIPPALRRLRPYELEDVLCIYKDDFLRLTVPSRERWS